MTIAAYAVGAEQGYLYIRDDYRLAIQRMQNAIRLARKNGLLGSNIGNTPFTFNVDIRRGAGAYVCGEETALIASIEGGRGTPHPCPPFPAASGLWGHPTLVNNVETMANVAPIINHGADWFAAIGTDKSKGTKVFGLSGRVVNTGLVEIPMGTTLRELVVDIGGGCPDGHAIKAVHIGGPAGGCIPAELLDLPIDYESLLEAGVFMGSGSIVVMDDTSCVIDVARYFMDFCRSESCGKCFPCRTLTQQMYDILSSIAEGDGRSDSLSQLEGLCEVVRRTSLCGLGQGAPNPVYSTIRYFRDEYLSHIFDKSCPAGVCPLGATAALK
jgi:bidirectional [NiFe] hydrogenase diaphorase subunit